MNKDTQPSKVCIQGHLDTGLEGVVNTEMTCVCVCLSMCVRATVCLSVSSPVSVSLCHCV